jgi:hypothetical protein
MMMMAIITDKNSHLILDNLPKSIMLVYPLVHQSFNQEQIVVTSRTSLPTE